MSAKYEGQSPSRLWYALQRTKAYMHCLKDKRTEKDAKKMARNGGYAAGSLVASGLAGNYLFFIPLVPTLVPLAGAVVGGYFGWKAWQKVKLLKNSDTVHGYIRKQEDAWVQKKSRPSLTTRAAALGKRLFGRAALPFALAGKWGGYGTALLGLGVSALAALQLTGTPQVSFAAGVAKLGAALGVSSGVAMTGTAVLAVIAIPVGLGLGKVCRSLSQSLKKDFIAHKTPAGARPTLKSRLAKPVPQNATAPAAKTAPEASKAFSETAPAQDNAPQKRALSEEQKKAAEIRARNRKAQRPQF